MRSVAVLVLVLAGCWSSDPKPPSTPAPVASQPAPARAAALDWPALIGKPEPEAKRAIARYLGVAEPTNLEKHGIEVSGRDGNASTIFLHVQPEREGKPVYTGRLFLGIEPTMTRDQIIGVLGQPDERGRNDFWIKYRRPDAQIHFQFTGDQLYMVTLMRADWSPGS